MRILVCGSRFTNDHARVWAWLDEYRAAHPGLAEVVEGGALGVDRAARQWALSRGLRVIPVPALWAEEGKLAGPIRNQRMLDEFKPDVVVAFPGGKGTADMLRRARRAGIPTEEPWIHKQVDLFGD